VFSCTCRPFRNTKGKHSTANIHARVNHTAIANLLPAGWARVLPILKFVEPPRCFNRRGLLGLLVIMLAKAPPQPKNPRKHYSLSEYSQVGTVVVLAWQQAITLRGRSAKCKAMPAEPVRGTIYGIIILMGSDDQLVCVPG